MEKTCSNCSKVFIIDHSARRYCLECSEKVRKNYLKQYGKKYSKQYYLNNQEKLRLSSKEYHLKNITKINENRKQYRLNNKEKISKSNKEYRLNNKEKIALLNKEYRSKNLNKIKEYYISNKEKISQFSKNYRFNNRVKISLLAKEYRLKNKDKIKQNAKLYYLNNKDKIKISRAEPRKKYYLNNKEKINQKAKQYYLSNKDKVKNYQKEYKKKNWDKIKQRNRPVNLAYIKKRYKNDPAYRILINSRQRLKKFLRKKKINKNNTTLELIGCTPQELKIHIEKQFLPGMTWENYRWDVWHIDHKKPISLAKNINDLIRLKLIHYTNLQPMWAKDNIKKSNKY